MNLLVANYVTAGTAAFGLLFLGGSLWFVVHLIFSSDRGTSAHFVSFALRTTAVLLIFIGTLAIILAIGAFVAVPALAILLIVTAMIANRIRADETRALMWQMSIASRKGIPIITTARAFAQERTDEIGHRTMVMVNRLEQGATLRDAMRVARLPMRADMALVAQTGLGQLSLHEVAAKSPNEVGFGPIDSTGLLHRLLYLISVCGFGLFSWFFMVTKICPSYRQIMLDFGVEPPAITAALLRFSSNNQSVLAAVLMFVFLMTIVLLAIPSLIYYIGWFRWEPPILRRLSVRYHGAIILRGLAASMDQRSNLREAIPRLAAAYPTRYVRNRLNAANQLIESGGDWIDAFLTQRLISKSTAGVLRAAERVGNLPWAMREMAGSLLRNLTFRITATMQIVTVAAILTISIPIGLFAIALFAPLPEFITQLL